MQFEYLSLKTVAFVKSGNPSKATGDGGSSNTESIYWATIITHFIPSQIILTGVERHTVINIYVSCFDHYSIGLISLCVRWKHSSDPCWYLKMFALYGDGFYLEFLRTSI